MKVFTTKARHFIWGTTLLFSLICMLWVVPARQVTAESVPVNAGSIVNLPGQVTSDNNFAFSSDGKYGVVAPHLPIAQSSDPLTGRAVYVFDAQTGQILDQKLAGYFPTSVTVHPSSGLVAVRHAGNQVEGSPESQGVLQQASISAYKLNGSTLEPQFTVALPSFDPNDSTPSPI
ncbi:MAG TPA: hypothetical protein PLL06_13850, partial [Acidobacteriota bacterium]|nr:hypothetical protein [Acidobacteriota bacterium]